VEQSTVRPSAEMMELIEASRAFEANVNLIHTQDEMLSALVTRALRTE
jgi:flagellar basal-body rod protein FlgF/flagellar basal-body rod protein FlgG